MRAVEATKQLRLKGNIVGIKRMNRNKTLALAGIVVAAVVMAGCGASGGDGSAGGSRAVDVGKTINPSGSKLSLAFVNAGAGNAYGARQDEAAKEIASELGIEIKIFDANFSATTQLNLLQNIISSGRYNAVSTLPLDGDLLCRILSEQAPAANIMVSVVSQPLCGRDTKTQVEEGWTPGTLNLVSPAGVGEGIRTTLEACAEENPGPQKLIVLTGPETIQTAKDTYAALDDIPDFTVSQKLVSEEYSEADGVTLTRSALLANPDATLVFSVYGGLTTGVVRALEAADRTDVKVCGINGGQEADVAALAAGKISVEAINDPMVFLRTSLQSLKDAWEGKEGPRVITLGSDRESVVPYTKNETIYTTETASEVDPY